MTPTKPKDGEAVVVGEARGIMGGADRVGAQVGGNGGAGSSAALLMTKLSTRQAQIQSCKTPEIPPPSPPTLCMSVASPISPLPSPAVRPPQPPRSEPAPATPLDVCSSVVGGPAPKLLLPTTSMSARQPRALPALAARSDTDSESTPDLTPRLRMGWS